MLLCLCSNLLFSKYRNLHSSMFENVLKSTMRFFHVSPIGRILNRFSSDMAQVDEQLNKAMGVVSLVSYRDALYFKVYNTVYLYIPFQIVPEFIALVLVICICQPPAILAAIVACLLYIFVRQIFIPTARY